MGNVTRRLGTLVSCNSAVSACVQSLQWHLALGLFEMPHGVDLITWLWQHGVAGGGVRYGHDFISGVMAFDFGGKHHMAQHHLRK